ncbi:hypothetical protein ACN20G_16965 [Streptomyces sp. BI20]|uniref:hypothetical protein n=1 Tax=Streptomyces sp. BI20 TaxID=3403460 RepID=UPI003C75DB24
MTTNPISPITPSLLRPPRLGPALEALARRQRRVLSRTQLLAAGVTPEALARRCRPGGPWQRLLPRVHLLQTGPPDRAQRALAAVLYAAPPADPAPLSGADAVLSGGAALALHGIAGAPAEPVTVLVRSGRRPAACRWARPRATGRRPAPWRVAGVPSARPVRAVADLAADLVRAASGGSGGPGGSGGSAGGGGPGGSGGGAERLRAVCAAVVQAGWCGPAELRAELAAARVLSHPWVRPVVEELSAGVRSPAEGRARELVASATDLPTPVWNAPLCTPDGAFLAVPDAYWPDEGVALEVDSAEYHFARDAWQATVRRRLRMQAHGVLVVGVTPALVRDRPAEVLAALRAALAPAPRRDRDEAGRARAQRERARARDAVRAEAGVRAVGAAPTQLALPMRLPGH